MAGELLKNVFRCAMDHAPYPLFKIIAGFAAPRYRTPQYYPGWRFGIAEEMGDQNAMRRLSIWRRWSSRFPQKPFKISWYHNLKLWVWMGNDMSRCTYVGGAYEPNEMHFIDQFLQPGMQFIDIGANEGIYSILAAARVGGAGKVWAIEPSSREFERLQQNIKVNDLQQIKSHRVAVSDHAGTASLKIAEHEHAGQNTLGEFIYQINSDGLEQVELTTLDILTNSGTRIRPDLIKIDVEGLEPQVLKGAVKTLRLARPVVMFEQLISSAQLPKDMADFWQQENYRIYCFMPNGMIAENLPASHSVWNLLAVPEEKTDLIRKCNLA